jgi:hypothetical protein
MVWIQYWAADGSQSGTDSEKADDAELGKLGKAQIYFDGNAYGMMVDITQNPPVVIPIPPSPSPVG